MTALHVTNARIWTGDPAHPFASSLTIRDGRIESLDSIPDGDPVLDCGGDFVTPGFIDAHMHLVLGGEALTQPDLSAAESRTTFESIIAQEHERLPRGQWLIANGWSEQRLGVLPDQRWLAKCGDRPAVCWRMDLHAAIVNDAVLQRLDLPDDALITEAGGRVGRDSTGALNGFLVEQAAWEYLIPSIPDPSATTRQAALLAAESYCIRHGLTTVRTMEYREILDDVIVPLRDQLRLRCAVVLLDRKLPLDLEWTSSFPADQRLQIVGCKSFIDGTLGSRTARLHTPWSDRPGDRGLLLELALEQRLHEWQRHVHAASLDTSVHAIGDEAVSIALELEAASSGACRCIIEHAELIRDEDVTRTAGVLLSMQPLHRAVDACIAETAIGTDRSESLCPFRRLHDAGAILAFGSDWPVVDCDPRPGLKAAITGMDLDGAPYHAHQRIDPETALHGWTTAAAMTCRRRDIGCLSVQACGDLVRWSEDLLHANWVSSTPQVMTTVLGGEVVYDVDRGIEP
jgi:predicted amidohydrolase YtcJ